MVFIDIHDVGQLAALFGIVAILITTFFQIRSYKREQQIEQERNRLAITTEINEKAEKLASELRYKLEAIVNAGLLSKEDIGNLRTELRELKDYVNQMDRQGTIEWNKVKPFIIQKVEDLEKRIDDLESRLIK